MKNFIFFLLLFVSTVSRSQGYYESKILDVIHVGFDSEKQLKNVISYSEVQEYSDFDVADNVKKITLFGYMYNNTACNLTILLVNDVVYGVQYYPLKDKHFLKYTARLDKKYARLDNWENPLAEVVWANQYVTITKEMNANFDEYFTHYSTTLLKKYPMYKDF